MFVRLTLYKSGFDEGNPFVGESKEGREIALSTLPQKIIQGSYNPNRPFRIVGNFLEFDRQFDYLKYELAVKEDFSDSWVRYYFIKGFIYVNDSETEIAIENDLISDIFYDLKFSRILPKRYTYKPVFGVNENSATFNKNIPYSEKYQWGLEKTLRAQYTFGGVTYYAGAFILSSLANNVNNYVENGVTYPFENAFLPFIYTEDGQVYLTSNNTSKKFNYFFISDSGAKREVKDATTLYSYLSNSRAGFNNIGSFIWWDFKEQVSFSITGNASGGLDIVFTVDRSRIGLDFGIEGYLYYFGELSPGPVYKLFTLPNLTDILDVAPYTVYKIISNDTEINIDRLNFNTSSSKDVFIMQSLVPPYNLTISGNLIFTEIGGYAQSNNNFTIIYNDAQAEWYRNNYNSTVQGLKTQQKFNWKNFGVKTLGNVAGAASSFLTAGLSTYSTAQQAGNAKISATGNLLTSALGVGLDAFGTLLNNQRAQQMLDLQLKDIENRSDSASFSGAISDLILSKKWLRVLLGTQPNINEMKTYIKCYGFEWLKRIKNIRSHEVFDYIETSDYVLSGDSIKLTTSERALLDKELATGKRLWYKLENYKNFNAPNPEIGS